MNWLEHLRRKMAEAWLQMPAPVRLRLSQLWAFIKEPVLTVLMVLVATTAVARPYYVPTGSMEPTIQIGDDLLSAKFAYGYSRYSLPFGFGPESEHRLFERIPNRGDVVTFNLPRDPSEIYIKRVIGLPGDRIQMVDGNLWINGKKLPLQSAGTGMVEGENGTKVAVPEFVETLPNGVKHRIFKWQWDGPLDNTQVFVVPAGHLFMMGDNRDNSLDSRVAADDGGVGFVPMENLTGRAEIVLGSVDFKNAPGIWAWPAELRATRFLKAVR